MFCHELIQLYVTRYYGEVNDKVLNGETPIPNLGKPNVKKDDGDVWAQAGVQGQLFIIERLDGKGCLSMGGDSGSVIIDEYSAFQVGILQGSWDDTDPCPTFAFPIARALEYSSVTKYGVSELCGDVAGTGFDQLQTYRNEYSV